MAVKQNVTRNLVIAFAVVALIGLALIFARQSFEYSVIAYDVLIYTISIVALVLAVLSLVNSFRQARVMKRMVRDVHKAVEQLEDVSNANERIRRKLGEEYKVNQAIADVLAGYGLGDNEEMRTQIAKKVSRRIKKLRK